MFTTVRLHQLANIAELGVIFFVLLMTLLFQFGLHELPCPLCLLQRVGFIGMAIGLLMNLRFGFRPSHYAITLLSGIFTSFVALRQIALHVVPGTGEYGSAFLGLHLYTWSFVVTMVIIIMTVLLLSIDRQYVQPQNHSKLRTTIIHVIFILIMTVIFTNLIAVILECGFGPCPDNPSHYLIKW